MRGNKVRDILDLSCRVSLALKVKRDGETKKSLCAIVFFDWIWMHTVSYVLNSKIKELILISSNTIFSLNKYPYQPF